MTQNNAAHVIEIMVTGLPGSGKTTFIKTISQRLRKDDPDIPGWLLGQLAIEKGLVARFLEPPRMAQFDFMGMRELIENVEVPGYIVLLDSSRPQTFGAAVSILETIRATYPNAPLVLVANLQDRSGAWNANDIRMGLGIPDDIPVVSSVASNRKHVKNAVLELLYQIFAAAQS